MTKSGSALSDPRARAVEARAQQSRVDEARAREDAPAALGLETEPARTAFVSSRENALISTRERASSGCLVRAFARVPFVI